jgi:hypothetical protein
MVVGNNMVIRDIPNLLWRIVIGRFYDKSITLASMKHWLEEN